MGAIGFLLFAALVLVAILFLQPHGGPSRSTPLARKVRCRRKQKFVAVTGASAGLGRAIVREFARHGAHIGLIARGSEGLDAARAEAACFGGRAVAQVADVADAARMEEAAGAIEDQFGPIDIWINNAMTSVFSPFSERGGVGGPTGQKGGGGSR